MEQDTTNDVTAADVDRNRKKAGMSRTGHAFLIGLLIGVAVFAAVKKGFGFAFFLPLVLAFLVLRNGKRSNAPK
jgi:hypothetical protein